MSSLDPSVKLYRETLCKHGWPDAHSMHGIPVGCPGGSREEVVIDYEAALDVWLNTSVREIEQVDGRVALGLMKAAVDAALKSAGFTKTFTSEKEHRE